MREIKFRAWDGIEMRPLGGAALEAIENPALFGKKAVMQYTGLKDRNGREIYEGDILQLTDKREDGICIVQWDKEYCAFGARRPEEQENYAHFLLAGYLASVIGNIYENPELLKV